MAAMEKCDNLRLRAARLESFQIRTVIIDGCNATDEVFEQILLGVEAQDHIRNIHYTNHNSLGGRATAILKKICARKDSDYLVELNLSNVRVGRPEVEKAPKRANPE